MGTHPIFESDFDCLTEIHVSSRFILNHGSEGFICHVTSRTTQHCSPASPYCKPYKCIVYAQSRKKFCINYQKTQPINDSPGLLECNRRCSGIRRFARSAYMQMNRP